MKLNLKQINHDVLDDKSSTKLGGGLGLGHSKTKKSSAKSSSSNRLFSKISKWLDNGMVKSVLLISIVMVIGRGLGFFRNVLIYQNFDSTYSDLFFEATKIPDLITSIFVLGTVISVLIPVSSRIKEKYGKEDMIRFVNLFQVSATFLILSVSVFAFAYIEQILSWTIAESSIQSYKDIGLYNDFILVSRILLLGPIIFATQHVLYSFLNVQKQFWILSWAPVVYNVGAVLGLLVADRNDYVTLSIYMMGFGILGTLLYYVVALKVGYRSSGPAKIIKTFSKFKKDFAKAWIAFLPRLFLLNGMVVANQIINKVQDTNGQVTAFDIGLSIQGVFLILIGAIGAVLFPNMTSLWNRNSDKTEFFDKLFRYNRRLLVLGLIGFVGTFLGAPVVMWFFELFGDGQGNSDYIILIVQVLSFALIFQAVTDVITKYFYVREKVFEPVIIYLLAGFFQVGLSFYLSESIDAGLAVSIGLIVNVVIVYLFALLFIARDYKRVLNDF